jgi:spore germination protein YaaH
MVQQTAVEWLFKEMCRYQVIQPMVLKNVIKQAKQIEKEQIKAAYNRGYQDAEIDSLGLRDGDVQYFDDAEQYYNETFGK